MILPVPPVSFLKGTIPLPPSKSYSIRAFLIAACGGTSQIINPSRCDDAQVARRVARALGAQVTDCGNNTWRVKAPPRGLRCAIRPVIHVKESGTVLRMLLPLAALHDHKTTITGTGTLLGRPNAHLLNTLRTMGARIQGSGKTEGVPVIVDGGFLRGGHVTIEGTMSSQFISALLIAAPQLSEDTVIEVTGGTLVSHTYITMTEQVLQRSGVAIRHKGPRRYLIKGNQTFMGLKNFTVPSDYGLAAFWLVAAALIPSALTAAGHFPDDLVQADGAILPLLKKMGVPVKKQGRFLVMHGPYELKGGSFSLKDCPDLVPIMAVAGLFARGRTRLYDIKHVRAKESDRIRDLSKELRKIGAHIQEQEDEITIVPQRSYRPNVLFEPHADHRLAMALSMLGLRIGARVKDIACTHKSYPEFVATLRQVMKQSARL